MIGRSGFRPVSGQLTPCPIPTSRRRYWPIIYAIATSAGVSHPPPTFGPALELHTDGALNLPEILLSGLYSHRHNPRYASHNAFGGLLEIHSREESASFPDAPAGILSIALHVLDGPFCLHLTDTALDTVEFALDLLT
ncbi:hypothetical protein K466DRAFT_214812 [Polyporus arcularius HHB13444]|uniref:Uncharacterized protein n=1 Tax=Polyporus arcularius HHB13444 TaxID=1314778 RepID=A0A5C3P5H9_9APHY|nr:hypothetical protein K466DRAFT_214812 [Polyporus arcularius HHB13444]